VSIPREFIELLLSKIDLVDLINSQVPLRKKSGSNYFARCPFHNEKSASFSVSQPKQFYYCFGCGAHGNAIDFLMHQDHLSFPEAIDALARQCGLDVPNDGHAYKKDEAHINLYDFMAHVAQIYYEQMCRSERAIQYLKNRGISGQIAKQFLLGYAPSSWNYLFDTIGIDEKKKLLDTGLIVKKNDGDSYYDRFRDRILFPIMDYRGRFVGLGGRILDKGEPKYLNSPETILFQKGHELYGLYQALKINKHLDRIMIVEGYMDVIALFQHGITYAVATLGTATTPHHLQRLFRYTRELLFCFDGDEAGRRAAWRALEVSFPLMQDDMQIRFLFLPDKEDPDSLIRKEGKQAFEERIKTALPLTDFFLQTLSQQVDRSTMEGRSQLAARALTYLNLLPNGLLKTLLLDELSKRTRIAVSELKKPLLTKDSAPILPEKETTSTTISGPIRTAIVFLLQHPELAHSIKAPLPPLQEEGYDFLHRLIEIINANPTITSGSLREHWRGNDDVLKLVLKAQNQPLIPETGIENEFLGVIRQIHNLSLDAEINRWLAKASDTPLSDAEKVILSSVIAKKKALQETN
jgi:DNA primase